MKTKRNKTCRLRERSRHTKPSFKSSYSQMSPTNYAAKLVRWGNWCHEWHTFSDDFPRDFRFHEDASTTTLLWHTVRPCPCWYFSSTKNRFFVISMFPAHDFRTDKIQDCIGNKDGFRSQNSPNVISTRQQGRTVMLFEGWSPRFAKGFVFPDKIRSTWMQEKSLNKPKLHRKLRCTSSFARCLAPRLLRISFGCSLYSFPLVQGMLYTAHCFFSRNSVSSFQINQKTSFPRNNCIYHSPNFAVGKGDEKWSYFFRPWTILYFNWYSYHAGRYQSWRGNVHGVWGPNKKWHRKHRKCTASAPQN